MHVFLFIKTYSGIFGDYQIDTPSAADEGAEHFCTYGRLSYNCNEKERNRLFIGMVKSFIGNSIHKENFDSGDMSYKNYMDYIPQDEETVSIMKEAYRALVKTFRTMLDKVKDRQIKDPEDMPLGAKMARGFQYQPVSESTLRKIIHETLKKVLK